MYTGEKKVLSVMTYFALIAFMITFVVFAYILLTTTTLPLWAEIAYYVLISALVLNIILDIVCTFAGSGKFTSGIILYILTFAVIIVSMVLGSSLSVGGVIPTEMLGLYGGMIGLVATINILSIIIYSLGERIVVYSESPANKRR
ncbi:MAG: hypothetical protein J6X00_00140 [Clostridia bacterium]|nr:hypothetical protein [Clostridia bacterium]